jgi:hypothetical protein
MLLKAMKSQTLTPNPISPDTGEAESKMRRNLGLDGGTANGSVPSSSNDPMKVARQAIRSQVTAREYTERQLAQAQTAIQDLRTRMRHVHQELEAAISAAQSAMTAKDIAERTMRAAETALATERATRARTEGRLREAEATIRDLREKLATANQTIHTMRAELAAERLTRPKANDAPLPTIAVHETVMATVPGVIAPIVRRPVGRPRKAAVVETAQAPIWPMTQPQVIRDAGAPAVRRPVGRPRKTAVVHKPVGKPDTSSVTPQAPAKVVKKNAPSRPDDQEPVQWWVEGWKKR